MHGFLQVYRGADHLNSPRSAKIAVKHHSLIAKYCSNSPRSAKIAVQAILQTYRGADHLDSPRSAKIAVKCSRIPAFRESGPAR